MPNYEEHRLRVCVDCLFMFANGEGAPFPDTWAESVAQLWPSDVGWHISLGWSESLDGDDHGQGFGSNPCNACGSHMAGDRFNATAWRRDEWDVEFSPDGENWTSMGQCPMSNLVAHNVARGQRECERDFFYRIVRCTHDHQPIVAYDEVTGERVEYNP